MIRLGTQTNAANASRDPAAGDPSVSVRGAIAPSGGTRHDQVMDGNAVAFCQPESCNPTNGRSMTRAP